MKYFYRLLISLSGCLIFLLVHSGLGLLPSLAAEKVTVRYGLFEQSIPVADIRNYGETQKVSADLQSFLHYLSPKDKQKFQEALQVKMSLDIVALDKLINTGMGKQILSFASGAIARRDRASIQALRSAIIIGARSPEGLGITSFLQAYPSNQLVVDVSKIQKLAGMANFSSSSADAPPKDDVSSSPLGKIALQYQTLAAQDKQFSGCLFGDSISAGLGNTLGSGTFNFGLNGLSTISLLEQLKSLIPTKVKCEKAIIAIGGNDALYKISDELFSKNLQEAIALLRTMGTKEIFLIPAFYSTVAASSDPTVAAPLARVEQINVLINQVAETEKVPVAAAGLAPLYENNVLKENLTSDGDHLNAEGLKIYRQALLQILGK
ncbi:alpha/beta hydrolase [Nostoc sp. 'Lobaria pulmonaria (5183) cyanobiont']|uniref:alpha/beta hydrolase n=1 Tax=Nostoc sp. 'Lobaria pulmonaria (5183) cyanobiont' TaxID=1618022 RepID=UPI000CF34553|nr:alpha/beta hydrolase [Nostoc sp. 'Lobaria pulmonaria (5183) cyanobiont']AVH73954.1 GDSL family lipase [Nostoc sp. 'Lobaria pulmonaria (5183) cyanobiont']